MGAQGRQTVAASGVQLEGHEDERRSHGIDDDRPNRPALESLGGVEVADRCAKDGAASSRLLAHLVLDVFAVGARLEAVEDGQEASHGFAERGVVDVLGGRDHGHAKLPQFQQHGAVLHPVPVHPGSGVDEHVVDVAVLADAFEHLLEDRSCGNSGGALTRLNVLVDDLHAVFPGLFDAAAPLGWDRDALGVVVGVDLAGRGHAQVQHRTTPGASARALERSLLSHQYS
nr:hypothetical protein [Nocardioides faecalis]